MSDESIEFCPWCGESVEYARIEESRKPFHAHRCVECETAFIVEVPHEKIEIRWSEAR